MGTAGSTCSMLFSWLPSLRGHHRGSDNLASQMCPSGNWKYGGRSGGSALELFLSYMRIEIGDQAGFSVPFYGLLIELTDSPTRRVIQ